MTELHYFCPRSDNWHVFAAKSPHKEGDTTYRVVDKGEDTNKTPNRFSASTVIDFLA